MNNYLEYDRLITLIGLEKFKKLRNSKVIIFGVGGVGAACCLALARAGIGNITIVDKDTVDISNINRQALAFHSTLDKSKVDVMKEMIKDIDDKIEVNALKMFFLPENSREINFSNYDYVIDCVDNVSAKIEIIKCAKENNVKVISSMGTANKLDPTKFEIKDINQTSVCPLARVMRYELKKRDIKDVKVLFSKEEVISNENNKGTISTVPNIAGLLIANYVITELMK